MRQIEKIAEMIANNPIGNLDTELLDNRLLKGKYDVLKLLDLKRKDFDGLRKVQGNIEYLKGLIAFFENLKGFLSNCRYADDDRVKDLGFKISDMIRSIDIAYWVDERQAVLDRIEKDKRNKEEEKESEFYAEQEKITKGLLKGEQK